MQFLKSKNKNVRTQSFKKYKRQKGQTPNQKMQNQKTYKFKTKTSQMSQPHVHFEKQEPTCKINAKPTCYFLNPAIQSSYF